MGFKDNLISYYIKQMVSIASSPKLMLGLRLIYRDLQNTSDTEKGDEEIKIYDLWISFKVSRH